MKVERKQLEDDAELARAIRNYHFYLRLGRRGVGIAVLYDREQMAFKVEIGLLRLI